MRWLAGREVRCSHVFPAMPLFYWVTALCELFTHIASPVFSAPRNWEYSDWTDLTSVRQIKLNGGL